VILVERLRRFGCRTNGALTANTDTFTTTDALLDNPNGLLVFYPDGFGGADRQTCAPTGTQVTFETHEAG
jgi:poly(3-hydroxybutyrate) depolymerase